MPAFKERAKTLVELFHAAAFLVAARPLTMDERAAALLDADGRAILGRLVTALSSVEWSPTALEEAVRKFAEAEGLKLGKAAQPLRAALTGSAASPPIFDVLVALGREESLARLKDQAA
jgi:glutamyl-tRNA synthetase